MSGHDQSIPPPSLGYTAATGLASPCLVSSGSRSSWLKLAWEQPHMIVDLEQPQLMLYAVFAWSSVLAVEMTAQAEHLPSLNSRGL